MTSKNILILNEVSLQYKNKLYLLEKMIEPPTLKSLAYNSTQKNNKLEAVVLLQPNSIKRLYFFFKNDDRSAGFCESDGVYQIILQDKEKDQITKQVKCEREG